MDFENIYVTKDELSGNLIQVYIFANVEAAKRTFRVQMLDLIDKKNKSMIELMKDTNVYKYVYESVKVPVEKDGKVEVQEVKKGAFKLCFSLKDLLPRDYAGYEEVKN